MRSEKKILFITGIGPVKEVPGVTVARRQIIKLKEPAFVNTSDSSKNGKDNHYQVEVWNAKIEHFNLLDNFKIGDKVELQFWINGSSRDLLEYEKYENKLVLSSIIKK